MLVKLYFCKHVPNWRMAVLGEVPRLPKQPTVTSSTLGVGYVKSNCESKDVKIEIVTDPRQLAGADLIGLSSTSFGLREAVWITRRFAKVPVVIGGYGTYWDGITDHRFEHIVRGDGELAFAKILRGETDSRVVCEWVKDLDSLKFPHRQDIRYAIHAVSSRGCCYKCKFCTMASTQKLRFHSPEWFVDDVERAHRQFPHVTTLTLDDDLFAMSEKRLEGIVKVYTDRGLHKVFKRSSCNVRGDRTTPRMVKLLRRMNITMGRIGVESFSDHMLQVFGKSETAEQQQKAIDLMSAAGMQVVANLIHGGPGETEEDRRITMEYVERNRKKPGVQFANIHYTPLPGSALYDGTSPLAYKEFYGTNNPDE